MVGLAYSLGGRWKEAEELEVQVMETTKRVLGGEHPDTLTNIDNLASIYRNQGTLEGGRRAGDASDGDNEEGYGSQDSRNTMSCAISSYASTLTAQIYAKQKPVTLKNGSSVLLLLVAMPKTPTQSDLQGAEREAQVIQDTFEGLMDVKLQKLPPVKRVLEDLPIYRSVFFACHGFADPQNPFRSGLLLYGNELGRGI